MLDCFAICGNENEEYQRTYLDEINLSSMVENNLYFTNKPVHIDRLFQNED